MAYSYSSHVALTHLTIHLLVICSSFTNTASHSKLALRLIHRHSIFSPSYTSKLVEHDDIRAPVVPAEDGTVFLVNISIGSPPVPQLMAMDTGSQLIWVHCTTCAGCKNIFNPQKSSTYKKLSGDSPQCLDFMHTNHKSLECSYTIRYQDLSSSKGVLALEKFTFLTSSDGTVEVPDFVFGCAQKTSGLIRDLNGVFGLESPKTGNKFSYCIGNISDTGYAYNRLVLGEGAVIQGDSTPMRIKDREYYVTLEGISVGEKRITVEPLEFFYNVAIDSGSTVTELVRSAYEPLISEVMNLTDGLLERVSVRNAEDQVCYSGDLERDLKGFPIVTLHLAEGVDVDLDVEAMFHRTRDGSAFCAAVIESEVNMIGVRAQQYYNVGFDLDAKRVSFQRIDCQLLEDY